MNRSKEIKDSRKISKNKNYEEDGKCQNAKIDGTNGIIGLAIDEILATSLIKKF
jgi:hypothetical protein